MKRNFALLATIFALLLGSNAGAAGSLYTGSFAVYPGTGSITDPNAPQTAGAHCVGEALGIYQYDSGCVASVNVGAGLANSGTATNPIIALSGSAGVTSITCGTNLTGCGGATPTISTITNPSFASVTVTGVVQHATALFTPGGASSTTIPTVYNDGGATAGLASSVPSGSTNGYRWYSNNAGTLTQVLQISVPSGNSTLLGTLTAANFFNGSRAEWKRNIRPFDGLAIVDKVHTAQYDCANAKCGPSDEHKIGIIANDSPVEVAGKNHDHYDAFALAAADTDAIKRLQRRVEKLEATIARLEREH